MAHAEDHRVELVHIQLPDHLLAGGVGDDGVGDLVLEFLDPGGIAVADQDGIARLSQFGGELLPAS